MFVLFLFKIEISFVLFSLIYFEIQQNTAQAANILLIMLPVLII